MTAIGVSEIGEFIRFHSCERRFKLGLDKRRLARAVPFSERLFNTLDPVLQEVGREAEDRWEEALSDQGLEDLTRTGEKVGEERTTKWEEFREMLEALEPGVQAYGREIEITGRIGSFDVTGRLDFIVVLWDRDTPRIRLVEGKASRKDRTYHRIQLAAYIMLVKLLLDGTPLVIGGQEITGDSIEGSVARIDEVTNEPQDILARPTLNLDTEIADLERLLSDDGLFATIVDRDLDELDFQLNAKCDGCVFSVHCLPESARQRRLELTGLDPTTCRVLRDNGVADIDVLAELDLTSPRAAEIKQAEGFFENLPRLVRKATARRSTLPRGDNDPDGYQVEALPHGGQGQLPLHEIDGGRLVRVYLQVDYDYSENRIGALSAHVTTSDHELHTPFGGEPRRPVAEILERRRIDNDDGEEVPVTYEERAIVGRDVIQFQTQPWAGVQEQDTAAERQLLQSFLFELVDAIAEVAQENFAPIHFYVYGRSEMTQLVEACTRVGGNLLSHLRELLGSRESLEQLIFSCIQDEIDSRYALGWTSRGLCVTTSLTWFGHRYHWVRRVGGAEVQLDEVFTQDLFDFKTTLDLNETGGWASGRDDRVGRHRFEIRSRFHDTLTAPYWRALWRALPEPGDPTITDAQVRGAIERYNRVVERPGLMRAYLIARVLALRWIDERVRFKNEEIEKPALEIARLQQFDLGVDTTGRAAIDFLRLDHHVGMTDWLTAHIQPLPSRVQSGKTIPVRNVRADADKNIEAEFDVEAFGLTGAELSLRTAIDEGSFVRLSPRQENPDRGQTLRQLTHGGITCIVGSVDWEAETIRLDPMFTRQSTYILQSRTPDADEEVFDFASIDESPSDFVAGRVESRLSSGLGRHVFEWFEPTDPQVPPLAPVPRARATRIQQSLDAWQVPHGAVNSPLTSDQRQAVIHGLESRIQLLKGPPGTGKTVTTAASVLARAAARFEQGDVILLAAHTHQAVNTLMARLLRYRESFQQETVRQGLTPTPVVLARVDSRDATAYTDEIRNFTARPCVTHVKGFRREGIVVIGGTTSALLKMVTELNTKKPYRDETQGFRANMLVVDEASMMVFPHFLALASLVTPDGEILLSGDNRQLAPIVSHDWDREDRPPAQYYQPFKSAYEAVLRIIEETDLPEDSVRQSALTFTFRLPPIVRELIARLYRDLDAIELEGREDSTADAAAGDPAGEWSDVWSEENGLVLIVHSERGSRQSNALESEIIQTILDAGGDHEPDTIAVITPHRAQRAMLRGRLEPYSEAVSVIDTVERLQGGERPSIIVSGTESDPHAIGAAASFILNLNRANVAFSRTQERLIVVCAATLLDHIPTELEDYESALLWKSLRNLCRRELLATEVDGFDVRVLAPFVRTED